MEQKHHDIQHDDTFLCIPPLYHTGAKFHWMGSLFAGSKAVLLKGTAPEIILKAVSDEQCTIVWLLVPWAQDILDALDRGDIKLDDYKLAQWRLMHIGAQPVPPSLITPLEGVFPPPQVRHQLRPVRVHRPGLRPPGHGEHPQGRCHRRPRLRLGGQDRGRAGPAPCPRARWASCA